MTEITINEQSFENIYIYIWQSSYIYKSTNYNYEETLGQGALYVITTRWDIFTIITINYTTINKKIIH